MGEYSTLTVDPIKMFEMKEDLIKKSIKELLVQPLKKDGTLFLKYTSGWKIDKEIAIEKNAGINGGGIYIFWWKQGKDNPLLSDECVRKFNFKGRKIKGQTVGGNLKHEEIDVVVTTDWLKSYGEFVPLYVGKSAGNILHRMTQHFQISQKQFSGPSTSNQLRRGLEELFPKSKDTVNLMVENVYYSYIPLDGIDNSVNRFFLETYLIGTLQSILNIDVER